MHIQPPKRGNSYGISSPVNNCAGSNSNAPIPRLPIKESLSSAVRFPDIIPFRLAHASNTRLPQRSGSESAIKIPACFEKTFLEDKQRTTFVFIPGKVTQHLSPKFYRNCIIFHASHVLVVVYPRKHLWDSQESREKDHLFVPIDLQRA